MISSLLLLIPQLLLVGQHAIMCYNMAVGNFVVISSPAEEEEEDNPFPPEEKEDERINKRRIFEKYISNHRPYLNPDLRITDLMQEFHTNRTYLSRFINREYGMSFSRYINSLRLQEMEVLRDDPACAGLSEEERACMAGFGNFRGYLRAKKIIEKEQKEKNI